MAQKSEVYTWRVSSSTKATLEEEARGSNRSMAQLLDEIVARHFSSRGDADTDADRQHRLHADAARFAGCMSSGIARRSGKVRELVRARLRRRRAHAR